MPRSSTPLLCNIVPSTPAHTLYNQVTVTDVADGCAASGLMIKGDSIFSINGTPITDEVQGRALARAAVGKVTFSILRGDQFVTIVADKPEATTRLGVTFKDKKRLHAVKLSLPPSQPPRSRRWRASRTSTSRARLVPPTTSGPGCSTASARATACAATVPAARRALPGKCTPTFSRPAGSRDAA